MTTTDTSLTMPASAEAASRYQRLRSHLAALKLHAAAEALPTVLDAAAAEQLSLTVALERLLAIEVDADQARRLAGRLRFASLPTPATLEGTVNLRSCGRSANHISLIRHTRPGESRRRTGENRPRIAQVDSAVGGDPGRLGHHSDTTRPQLGGLGSQPQSPLELRQMRSNNRIPPRHRVGQIRHSTTVAPKPAKTTLFHHRPLVPF